MSDVPLQTVTYSDPYIQTFRILEDVQGLDRAVDALYRERNQPSVDLPPEKLAQRNVILSIAEATIKASRDRSMDDACALWLKHRNVASTPQT